MAMGQNPGTLLIIPKTFKIVYSGNGVVTIPKKVAKVLTHSQHNSKFHHQTPSVWQLRTIHVEVLDKGRFNPQHPLGRAKPLLATWPF